MLQSLIAVSDGHGRSNQKFADTKLRSFCNLRHELTVAPNATVFMRGSRTVIPATLQERAAAPANEGHQGITKTKTKTLLRETVWFPCTDQMTDNAIKRCIPCQSATPRTAHEPLNMTPLPVAPSRELSTDYYRPLPTGEYLLIIIDEYLRYPVVVIVRSTSANTVIPVFEKVMSMFRIPEVRKSDNRPPFNSEQLHSFATHVGFRM